VAGNVDTVRVSEKGFSKVDESDFCPKFRIDFALKIVLFSLTALYHIDLKGDE
jgi:hypothetical protein